MDIAVPNVKIQKKIKSRPGRPRGSVNKKTRFIRNFQLDVSDFKTFNNSSSDLILHSRCPNYFPRAPRVCLSRVKKGNKNGSRNALSILESHLFFPHGNHLGCTEENITVNGGKENGRNSVDEKERGDNSCVGTVLKDNPISCKMISNLDVSKLKITLKNVVPGRLSVTAGDDCSQHQSCAESETVDMSCKLNNTLPIDNDSNIDHNSCVDIDVLNDNKEKNNVETNERSSIEMNISCGQSENKCTGSDVISDNISVSVTNNAETSSCELPVLSGETENGNIDGSDNCPPLLLPEKSVEEFSHAPSAKVKNQKENSEKETNRKTVSESDDLASNNNNDSSTLTIYSIEESVVNKTSCEIPVRKDTDENNRNVDVSPVDINTPTEHTPDKQETTEEKDSGHVETNETIEVIDRIISDAKVHHDTNVKNPKSKTLEDSVSGKKSKLDIKQERNEVTRKPLYQHDGYDSDATVIYDDDEERREKKYNRKSGSVCSPTKIKQTQELLRQRSKSISHESDRQGTVKTPETMECLESLYPYRGDNIEKSEDIRSSVTEMSDNEENRLLIDENDAKPKVIKTETPRLTIKLGGNIRNKIKQSSDKKGAKNKKAPKRRPSVGIKLTSTKWDQALTSCDTVVYTDMTISRNIVKKSLKNKKGKIRRQKKEKPERKKREENQDNILKNINKIFPKPRRKRPKDEDDLPTILPPKRRRQGKSNVAPDSKSDMDRINQEFPRFNWLEKKYTDVSGKSQEESVQQQNEHSECMTQLDEPCIENDMDQSLELTEKDQSPVKDKALEFETEIPNPLTDKIEVELTCAAEKERHTLQNTEALSTNDITESAEIRSEQNTIQSETDLEDSSIEVNEDNRNNEALEPQASDDIDLTPTVATVNENVEERGKAAKTADMYPLQNDIIQNQIRNVTNGETRMEVFSIQVPSVDDVTATFNHQIECVVQQQTANDPNTATQTHSSVAMNSVEVENKITHSIPDESAAFEKESVENANLKSSNTPMESLQSSPQAVSANDSSSVSKSATDLFSVQNDHSLKCSTTTTTTTTFTSNNTAFVSPENENSEPMSKKMRFSQGNISQNFTKNIPPLVPVSSVSKSNKVGLKATHLLGLGPEVDSTYNEIKELKRKIDALNREKERSQIELKQKEEMLRSLLLSSPLAPTRQSQPVSDANKIAKASVVFDSQTESSKLDKISKTAVPNLEIIKDVTKVPPPAHSGNKKENTRQILKVIEENPVPRLRLSWGSSSRHRPLSPPLRFKSHISQTTVAPAHAQKPFEHPDKVSHKTERSISQGNETISTHKVETSRAVSAPLQDRSHASPINLRRMAESVGASGTGIGVSKVSSNVSPPLMSQTNKSHSSAANRINFPQMSQKGQMPSQRAHSSPRTVKNPENEIQQELKEAIKRRQMLEASKLEQDYQQFKISKPENTTQRQQPIPTQSLVDNTQRNRSMQSTIPQHAVTPPQRQSLNTVSPSVQQQPPYTALQKASQPNDIAALNVRNLSSVSNSIPSLKQLPQSVRLIGAATIPSSNRPSSETPKSNPLVISHQHARHQQSNAMPINMAHFAPPIPGPMQHGILHQVQMTPHGMVPVPRPRGANAVTKMFNHHMPLPMHPNVPGNPALQHVPSRNPQIHKGIQPEQANAERQNQVVPPNPQPVHHQHTANRDSSNHRGMMAGHNVQQQGKTAVTSDTGKGQHIFGSCILCGKFSLYLCSTCQDVWYCSQQCQVISQKFAKMYS